MGLADWSDFSNSDSVKGVFGEVKGEADLFTTSTGWSAFVSGGWQFKSVRDELVGDPAGVAVVDEVAVFGDQPLAPALDLQPFKIVDGVPPRPGQAR